MTYYIVKVKVKAGLYDYYYEEFTGKYYENLDDAIKEELIAKSLDLDTRIESEDI